MASTDGDGRTFGQGPGSPERDAVGGLAGRGRCVGEEIERLAEFVAETTWDTIPPPVREHAKIVLLDTLGVIFAGSEQPEVEGLRPRLARVNGGGATVYARGFPSADPRSAALLNGIAGRSSRPRASGPAGIRTVGRSRVRAS